MEEVHPNPLPPPPPPPPPAAPVVPPVTAGVPPATGYIDRKSAALAGLLSMFPGLGHLYLGLYQRGLAFGAALPPGAEHAASVLIGFKILAI